MSHDNFFCLDFYPSADGTAPLVEELEREILRGPVEVQPFETWAPGTPFRESASSALRYSLHQREDVVDISFSGKDSEVVQLVLTLLQPTARNACLQANHRPVLTQNGGNLRLDLQRFWTPELLQLVRRKRDFVRARILFDFPEYGFGQEKQPNPRWERHLLQAIVNVFAPGFPSETIGEKWDLRERLGLEPLHPGLLTEFWRLSECRLRLDDQVRTRADLRRFLEQTAPHMYLKLPVLPAILIGGPPLIAKRPSWIHFFQHQHGGLGCLQFPCSGAILPLQLNLEVARLDPAELLDGLEAMAEGPDEGVLREHYPTLRPLVETHGDPYFQPQLDDLHQFLSKSYRLPRFTFGREALLEFEVCDPLDWFAGWQMVQIDSDEPVVYNRETHRQLQEWYGDGPKCYFMWNNSD